MDHVPAAAWAAHLHHHDLCHAAATTATSSTAPTDESDVDAAKPALFIVSRLPIVHACVGCAKLKAKCDGAKPSCARCKRRGVECGYVKHRKRGRKPASSVAAVAATDVVACPASTHDAAAVGGDDVVATLAPSQLASAPGYYAVDRDRHRHHLLQHHAWAAAAAWQAHLANPVHARALASSPTPGLRSPALVPDSSAYGTLAPGHVPVLHSARTTTTTTMTTTTPQPPPPPSHAPPAAFWSTAPVSTHVRDSRASPVPVSEAHPPIKTPPSADWFTFMVGPASVVTPLASPAGAAAPLGLELTPDDLDVIAIAFGRGGDVNAPPMKRSRAEAQDAPSALVRLPTLLLGGCGGGDDADPTCRVDVEDVWGLGDYGAAVATTPSSSMSVAPPPVSSSAWMV